MAASKIETQVTGYISPVNSGTRLRTLPQTYSPVITSYGTGVKVEIDKTILYMEQDPDQPATMKNDLWGHVIKVNDVPVKQECYMAIDYHGTPICTKHYTATGNPTPTEEIQWLEAQLRGKNSSGEEVIIYFDPRGVG